MVTAKIIGAGGYGGVGICELLQHHPQARVAALVDIENVGTPIGRLYPHLHGFVDMPIIAPNAPEATEPADVVFTATPDGVGMRLAPEELRKGAKVIDYSGDFRFNSPDGYAEYATRIGRDPTHACPDLLADAPYGLPELHRGEITEQTRVVGNPGCFAVSCILGMAPAVREKLVRPDSVICDCKTGVSGAGKNPSPAFHFPARYDHMNAYKLAGHQHVCEIERELSALAGAKVGITFTAQVIPVCRGIMSTLYADLLSPSSEAEMLECYRAAYNDEPFVRVHGSAEAPGSMHVRGSNLCRLVVSVDERNARLRIVSFIDNLLKGQAGCALQNMNLLFGFEETTGLDRPGMYP